MNKVSTTVIIGCLTEHFSIFEQKGLVVSTLASWDGEREVEEKSTAGETGEVEGRFEGETEQAE